jgi:glycerol-3-phosphate dehydrogenase (NAD(P)+)
MKVGFVSLGCSKNLIDTEVTIGKFKEHKFEIVNNPKEAEIIVINTCGFIESAKEEAINTILEMAEYKKKKCKYLVVMGCLVQRYYKDLVKDNQYVVMCSKGFEPVTGKTLDEVMEEELPGKKIGILTGPSHAEEVSRDIPTLLVCGSKHEDLKDCIVDAFQSPLMRIYTTDDVKGVELGGALKNIIAFCAGISVGLNLGDNTFAALATRGLVEIARLGVAMGGEEKTFYGLSGLGDLIVTCSSEHSRNRRAGKMIGQGHTIEEARKEIGMVIESVDNIDVAHELARKYNVEMPIVDCVFDVLYNGLDPREAVNILMTRKPREE